MNAPLLKFEWITKPGCFVCGMKKPRGAPPPAPPDDFCLGKSHQNRFAPEGSPASRVPRVSVRPPEVRIRAIPRPDAHAQHPCCAPLGSTSAFPRRSLAYGAGKPTELSNTARLNHGCRWAPYGAPSLAARPGVVREHLVEPEARCSAPGELRSAGSGEKRRKGSRHPGRLSFGDFSLATQRKVTCRGSATRKLYAPTGRTKPKATLLRFWAGRAASATRSEVSLEIPT